MDRREFAGLALTALGAAALGSSAPAAGDAGPLLPTVRWGKHDITRVLVGHNTMKGMSHLSPELSLEMREWFEADPTRIPHLLRRCGQMGINATQMGFRPDREEGFIEEALRAHYEQGGALKWVATFYSLPTEREAVERELARILRMKPRPIGIQQVGNTSDALMKQGKPELSLENLKRFRDAGLLVGLGSHNCEVIAHAEDKGWDVDFYQCSFYRSVFSLKPIRAGEVFEDSDREAMTRTIRQVSKPCLAFKVLGSSRHCRSAATVEAALRFAFENIKPADVVLLGMWQKHKDQVAENTAIARRILGAA